MINNITKENIETTILSNMEHLYKNGPIDGKILEEFAYIKRYFPETFSEHESEILFLMGLFYKTTSPKNMLETAFDVYKEAIKEKWRHLYTPNQSRIRKEIKDNLYYSFSAPTSSGKSHVFRDLIKDSEKDIVIIVPSRALISEYYLSIIELVSNEVLVLTFVDNINIEKTKRRIFILTPERSQELFKYKNIFQIELFLFDEAQITDEQMRGLRFDSLVRRTIKEFPNAKKVFAHPFINNPEVHFKKHTIIKDYASDAFNQKAVGQLFYYKDNNQIYLYSPYESVKNLIAVRQDDAIIKNTLENGGTILVYLAKTKIYNWSFLKEFEQIISILPDVKDEKALLLIEKIRVYLGASKTARGKQSSLLVNLLKKGIVLHHGSIPLKGRAILEEFIKSGHAKICFATSTLLKGINMPFDIVYIDNFLKLTPLDFKNLIGRAGRTDSTNYFNIGTIICSQKNVKKIIENYNKSCLIEGKNSLDNPIENYEEDDKDIVEAIQTNEFVDLLNIPKIQFERLKSQVELKDVTKTLIDLLMPNGYLLSGDDYRETKAEIRNKIKDCFKQLYVFSLRNKNVSDAEEAVLSTSLQILLWKIQHKSFREIVQIRYKYITQSKKQKELKLKLESGELSEEQFNTQIKQLKAIYTQGAFSIPNKHTRKFPLFDYKTSVRECDYDMVVYDTYDYLDKVISLSLVDPICAALEVYYLKEQDLRARALQNYIRFATNSQMEIMMLRYGFDFEDHEWLKKCISNISEQKIEFNENIKTLEPEQYKLIERYL